MSISCDQSAVSGWRSRYQTQISRLIVVLVIAFALAASAAAQVVVTEGNLNGWVRTQVGGSSTGFQVGPGPAPLGFGSGRMVVGGDGDDNSQFRAPAYNGTLLSDITALSYSTFAQSGGSGGQAPYVIINVDFNDGGPTLDDELFFEPVYQNGTYSGDPVPNQCGMNPNCVTVGQWQTWDVRNGGFWAFSVNAGGPPLVTWNNYIAAHPGARVTATAAGGIRMVVGGGAGAWDNFIGFVDNFTIGVSAVNTTYDFEVAPNVINVGAGSLTNTANYTQWFWWNDENDTINNSLGSFVTGPGTPPIGTGSAQTSVTGTQRRNLATYQFAATPLSGITVLRYSTYNPSAGNGGSPNRSGYLNFNIDFTGGSSSFQRRIGFVPSQNGTVIQDQWQEWDCINSGNALWFYSGANWPAGIGGGGEPGSTLKSWNQILSQYPNARVQPVDSWMGIRVGEPYNDGYTENIDKFTFGTATNLTIFNFDPLPAVVYVDDNWVGTPAGTDPDGAGPATSFGYDAFGTIQDGINGVDGGGTVNVAGGTYNERVMLNKPGITVSGSGAAATNVVGPIGAAAGSTFAVQASSVTLTGFTITRAGNNATDWNNPNLSSAGVSIQGQALTGTNINNNLITGMRTAIDVNNSNGHNIHNNVIDFNHTGLIFRNQTDNITFTENQVTNNRTVGLLFLDASGGTNVPVQSALNCTFFNNKISGNWYGEIVDRQSGGSLPAPGTTNLKDFSGNFVGAAAPIVTTANSAEPPYASMCPAEYGAGCTATDPGGQPDIAGPASANFDYTPLVTIGADINPSIYGYQGNFTALTVSPTSAQVGGTSKIQEGIDLITSGGALTIGAGSYPGNVNVNKALNIGGNFTVGGSFDVTAPGAHVRPGNSPGVINTGNLSFVAGSSLDVEVNGTNAGSQYDQMNVTGTVSLGGATLNMTLGYIPAAGHAYTIINNDGGDAVTGTFVGLPEGTVFYKGTHSFRISYVGGTGNDVVLTSVVLCSAVSIPTTIQSQTANSVNVPLNVDDTTGKGLYSTDFTLTYNPAVITTPVVTLGTTTAGSTLTVHTPSPGTLNVSIFNTVPFSGAGTLANVSYTVNGLPGSSSPVTFSAFMFNEGTQCISTSNGLVTVIGGTITGNVTYGNAIVNATPTPTPPAVRPVPNVTITGSGPTPVSTTTDSLGNYSLSGFVAGTYTRSASKSGGQNGAITSFDASRVARHVTGIEVFTGPNQATVADVSGNGQVTSFDASMIARYVAGPAGGSGTTGNWIFLETYGPSTVYTDITGENYTALLMGEVTGNWGDPGPFSPFSPIINDITKAAKLSLPNVAAVPGREVTVPVAIKKVANRGVTAYQFDVLYDPQVLRPTADPVSVQDTISQGYFVTVNPNELGRLRIVVFGTLPITADGTLLNIRFNAVGRPGSSSAISFDALLLNEGNPSTVSSDGMVKIGPAASDDTLSGRVLTATGQAVAGAEVTATDIDGISRVVLSDDTGVFRFADLTVGQTYTLTVNADGLKFTPLTVSMTERMAGIDMIAIQ